MAQCGGTPAGFVLMLDTMPDEVTRMPQGFVAYMAVEPWARGRGIGSRLLSAAEDEARRRGLPYMGLMVTEDNAAARRLYERAGYTIQAAFAMQAALEGANRRRVWMTVAVIVLLALALWFATRIPKTIAVFLIAAFVASAVHPSLSGSRSTVFRGSGLSRSCMQRWSSR